MEAIDKAWAKYFLCETVSVDSQTVNLLSSITQIVSDPVSNTPAA